MCAASPNPSSPKVPEILLECGAILEGHFLLASGRHSPFYIQAALVVQHPDRLEKVMRPALERLQKELSVETVLAPAIGALGLGQQVALTLGCRSIFAERNPANTLELRRGFTLNEGERILLVEDVVTTGSTLAELVAIGEEARVPIEGVFSLINRTGKRSWRGFPLYSAMEMDFPTYEASQCPLCAQSVELQRLGTKKVKSNVAPR